MTTSLACEPATAGYHGVVLGQPVYARLEREGTRLRGRYFYEKIGVDIALEGSVSPGLSVSLKEGAPDSPSGRFEGVCYPSSGSLTGTWTGARSTGPFTLDPVAPSDPPLVAKKRFSVRRGAGTPTGDDRGGCMYSEVALEFFGIADESVERKLNHEGVAASVGPWFAPARADEAQACAHEFQGQIDESLLATLPEMVSVGRGGYGILWSAPHPLNGSEFEPVQIATYDLRTGAAVVLGDVFAKDPMPLVTSCAIRHTAKIASTGCVDCAVPSNDEWEGAFAKRQFILGAKGAEFFADGFPHVSGVLNGSGPMLLYAVLLRDGYLRADSPVRRAWEQVKSAPASAQMCPAGHESEWWN
jgi:hypothetical protein